MSVDTPPNAPARKKRWPKVLIGIVGVFALLIVGAYAATAIMRVPPPHEILVLLNTPTSQQGELLPSRTVAASASPATFEASTDQMPTDVTWKGEETPVTEVLELTNTNAFVVLHNGELVEDWYAEGVTPDTQMSSWSVAKSIVSLLVGQAIDRGEITEDDRLVDVVPELETGGDFDAVTVGDLLDMSSGIDVPENYSELWPFTGTARLFLSTDITSYIMANRELTYEPGSQATYRSVDTQLLGMVAAAAAGKNLSEQLTDNIWAPIGANNDAFWNLDNEDGVEKAFCCINATALDFAKIGQLVLDDGQADGTQVISTDYIERISTPAPNPISDVDDWGYSAQWWHVPGDDQDFSAIGIYGQYIYVNPEANTVIVKLSDYGTEQDELETINMMRQIAADLSTQR